ncbi:hypothetical protein VTN49DRAFT_299 [Thermomyces lanuginosus]|uniref:uncharacterized protein n=1 Tax=Thermomyces lanuginosus TaxID=5541 RepID=UPI0037421E6F
MLPPFFNRRIPAALRLRPASRLRSYTLTSSLRGVPSAPSRPQLPFLSSPQGRLPLAIHLRQHFTRLISTERRNVYKRNITRGLRIGLTSYAIVCMIYLIQTALYHGEIEHMWPTPPEWSWRTRWALRSAQAALNPRDVGERMVNWLRVSEYANEVIKRCEDPNIDGKDVRQKLEGGMFVEGVGELGKDVSVKSEPWRRGYFEALMAAGRAAEHLEGFMTDWKNKISAPSAYVLGPSNPHPKKLPGNKNIVMHEEDCTPTSPSPDVFYMKILTTDGFNARQKIDAALAYADWLQYKGLLDTARETYDWAMDIATSGLSGDPANVVDKKTGVLKNNGTDLASENVIRVSTAMGVLNAKMGKLSDALSIFTSVLKARREMSQTPGKDTQPTRKVVERSPFALERFINRLVLIFTPVVYPPPPSDGNSPPVRSEGSLCDEAGLMTYIGEILFASSSRETGLAWTRDSVDIAESALVRLGSGRGAAPEREKCTDCLKVGLQNWKTMLQQLIKDAKREEQEASQRAQKSWFGGGRKAVEEKAKIRKRWEAEEMIVQARADDLLPRGDAYSVFAPGTNNTVF